MTVQLGAEACASAKKQLRASGGLYSLRPLPRDFADQAACMGTYGLKEHYHTGVSTIMRWYREAGIKPRSIPSRYSPPDSLAHDVLTMSNAEMAKKHGVSETLIRNWLNIAGVKPAVKRDHPLKRRMPEGFASVAPTMTMPQLQQKFDASDGVIRRWCSEAGVRWQTRNWRRSGPSQLVTPPVDSSVAAQAAQFLRRRFIVYRCDILPADERADMPNRGKGCWYINGRGAILEAQMIELAESRGFDPRAWARI